MENNRSTNSCFEWLKSIDMFGTPIRLHIHKQTDYKTSFGGFLSLCVIVIVTVSAISMIVGALYYSNINFISTRSLNSNKVTPLNSLNFIMAVEIQSEKISRDKSFYGVYFQHVTTSDSGLMSISSLGTTQCQTEYLSLHQNEMSNAESTNLFCPNITTYPISEKDLQYIQILIKKCENRTDSPIVCAPKDEIESYFTNPVKVKPLDISFYVTNNILDMLSTEPNVQFLKEFNTKIPGGNLGKQKSIYIYDEIVKAEKTILNALKKGIEVRDSFSIEEFTTDEIIYSDEGTFLEINIKKSELEKKYLRTFTKLEEVLAFLGGLSKALVIIVSAVAIPFNNFYYNLAISNQIYEFESRPKIFYKKTMKPLNHRKSKTFRELDAFSSRKDCSGQNGDGTLSHLEKTNQRLVHNEKVSEYHPFFESLLLRHHKLQYSIKEVVKNIFCCGRRNLEIKEDLFKQAKQRLRTDIDIITILRKLQDVDKLKQLLLTKDQLELFNYKKPLRIEYLGMLNFINKIPLINKRKRTNELNSEESRPRSSLYLHDRPLDTVEQFKDLFEAFQVVSKDSFNKFNSRLVEMLGPDILKIFRKLDRDYQSDVALIAKNEKDEAQDIVSENAQSLNHIRENFNQFESLNNFEKKNDRKTKNKYAFSSFPNIGHTQDNEIEISHGPESQKREIKIQNFDAKYPLIKSNGLDKEVKKSAMRENIFVKHTLKSDEGPTSP